MVRQEGGGGRKANHEKELHFAAEMFPDRFSPSSELATTDQTTVVRYSIFSFRSINRALIEQRNVERRVTRTNFFEVVFSVRY